jgi:glycosyltransferase involved in cell wall biosynthesis
MLDLISFGDVYPVGGVHTWNVRMASYFSQNPQHGIRWTVVEVGPAAILKQLRSGIPASAGAAYRLIEANMSHNPFSDARSLLKAMPELESADVIIPNLRPIGYLVWETLRRRSNDPPPALIGVVHSDEEYYYRLCSNAVVGSHELVVAVSAVCEKEFAHRRPGVRLERIPYGVEIPDQLPAKAINGKIHIAYIGRIIQHQKRALDLVNVAQELVNMGTAFELHVLGDGPERVELQKRLETVAPGQVTFHGPLPLPAVLEFLREKAHVSVLVSEWEGTSLTMLEAMANGVVPVVTDVQSGSREAIEHGVDGWRVPVGDGRAMAEVLTTLSRDHDLMRRAATHAYDTARERYALATCASRWATVVRAAAQGPRTALGISRTHFDFGRLQRPGIPVWLIVAARKARRAVGISRVRTHGR